MSPNEKPHFILCHCLLEKKFGAAGLQSAPGAAPAWINDTSSWKLRSDLQLRGASDENDARR